MRSLSCNLVMSLAVSTFTVHYQNKMEKSFLLLFKISSYVQSRKFQWNYLNDRKKYVKKMFCRKYCVYRNLSEVRELLLQLNFLCPKDGYSASLIKSTYCWIVEYMNIDFCSSFPEFLFFCQSIPHKEVKRFSRIMKGRKIKFLFT